MSAWKPVNARDASDQAFCPGCGAKLYFPDILRMPELIKCDGCKAQFCYISKGEKTPRPEANPAK